jgi:hypothetical protein
MMRDDANAIPAEAIVTKVADRIGAAMRLWRICRVR